MKWQFENKCNRFKWFSKFSHQSQLLSTTWHLIDVPRRDRPAKKTSRTHAREDTGSLTVWFEADIIWYSSKANASSSNALKIQPPKPISLKNMAFGRHVDLLKSLKNAFPETNSKSAVFFWNSRFKVFFFSQGLMMFQKFSLQSHFHLAAWNLVGVSIMNSSTTESQISHSSKDTWRLLFWSKSALWASILNHFQVFSKDELDFWSHARVQLMSPRRHTSKLRFQNSSGRFSRCREDNPNNHNGSLKKKKKEAIEQCDES